MPEISIGPVRCSPASCPQPVAGVLGRPAIRAFQDIAKRYPIKEVYVDLLARKVISGGTGSWGSPVMSPHPDLKAEDAKAMVSYILSLKE